MYGKALNYLCSRFPLVRLYEYTLAGARLFMAGAHGIGPVYELRAVELVQQMHDYLTRAIDQSLNQVRVDIVQKVIDIADGTNAEHCMKRIREVMDSDHSGLMQYLTRE
jgi:hypothetical protein